MVVSSVPLAGLSHALALCLTLEQEITLVGQGFVALLMRMAIRY